MNNYLYETIDTLKRYGNLCLDIPLYVKSNLNQKFCLRNYQEEAFKNFIFYFENESLKEKPTQVLFHMATGSGKTLIMAGLILYLYKKGYRNFLFFVNSTTIIEKTKDNFLNDKSSKYLFDNVINIDSKNIRVKEVSNFQNVSDEDINICFYTIQGLHMDINFVRENRLSIDDFENSKIVFISDEAHHINTISMDSRLNREEEELKKSWEYTINDRLLHSNNENVLLEFTATCDLENEYIRNKYLKKMIFNYPLSNFREDGFSKEVETLQSEVDIETKMLQSVLLSQYRLKVFQQNNLDIKPVILFKSDTIDNSKNNKYLFHNIIDELSEEKIYQIKENATSEILIDMFIFFEKSNITISNLVREIKDDFSSSKCISVNDDNEATDTQLIVNSLEDKNNLYRAIFEVKKLDEGWDVLNLFDIVRLYETRDGRNGKPGRKTIQEAQLIGRGARYCPFEIDDNQDKYKRKYDSDITNPLRICETLLYHCQYDSRYISELKIALKETGIIAEESKKIEYKLKDSFKSKDFYKNGLIFFNKRVLKSRDKVVGIPDSIKNQVYEVTFSSGRTKNEGLFEENKNFMNLEEKLNRTFIKIKEIQQINPNIIFSALRKFNVYNYNVLKSYFPNLNSIKQFVNSDEYLGNITISISCTHKEPTVKMYYDAVLYMLNELSNKILSYDEVYEGTKTFDSIKFREIFKDKIINVSNPGNDSIGISQKEVNDDSYKLDLSEKEWFAYNDNFGTTEEKKFVKYFNDYVDDLNNKYDEIFLIRNERILPIYSFKDGERFEPDYLLILLEQHSSNVKQYQIFIEPKGSHLLLEDKWKEELLMSLMENSIPTTKFVDNNEYLIWGFPFFNKDYKLQEFKESMESLINN